MSQHRLCLVLLAILLASPAHGGGPTLSLDLDGLSEDTLAIPIKLALLATVIGIAPAVLILATSFTRLIIVFHFIRQALGTPQTPPNQVLVGLAMLLTFFVMTPVGNKVYDEAIQPYQEGQLSSADALANAQKPIRTFMLKHTKDTELALFQEMAGLSEPETREEISTRVVLPAFVLSEIKTAFQIGFVLFLPFVVIDLVVASVLVSMGMLMLPPVVVSFPFKILLFVLVDGWSLVIGSTIRSLMQ